MPKTVTLGGKTLTYDYDAAGTKHKYVADTLTLKYAGAFEYRQFAAANALYRVALSEGQAVLRGGKLAFEYYLKDHLGNVRVVFGEKGQVLQRTDFYVFGLEIDQNNPVDTPTVKTGSKKANDLPRPRPQYPKIKKSLLQLRYLFSALPY